jgi:uracil-DNA glycosylase family 4
MPGSESADDGLRLDGCLITAVCHCAPPDNKPKPDEVENCSPFLRETLEKTPWKVVMCLGHLAYVNVGRSLSVQLPKFGHGIETKLEDGRAVLASYHPSQQNTFTGRLTEPMFDSIFTRARILLQSLG